MRLNTSAFLPRGTGGGVVRGCRPGTADILATVYLAEKSHPTVLWLECKSSTGQQSAAQKQFQVEVEAVGHTYLLIRQPEDLLTWLRAHSVIP